jgi:hypothetical protein
MIVEMAHLQKDPKTGVYRYRRKIPKHLCDFIPSDSPTGRGKTEFAVSLRTKSMKAPGANERLAAATRRFEDIVADAEKARAAHLKRATGAYDHLRPADVAALAARYHAQEMVDDDQRRKDPEAKQRARYAAEIMRKVGFELPPSP